MRVQQTLCGILLGGIAQLEVSVLAQLEVSVLRQHHCSCTSVQQPAVFWLSCGVSFMELLFLLLTSTRRGAETIAKCYVCVVRVAGVKLVRDSEQANHSVRITSPNNN